MRTFVMVTWTVKKAKWMRVFVTGTRRYVDFKNTLSMRRGRQLMVPRDSQLMVPRDIQLMVPHDSQLMVPRDCDR
jgi:hypothetical protein